MSEPNQELRYGFGKNWAEYIEKYFSQRVIEQSQAHLASFLRLSSLKGRTFLDIGCGSGLHSLAAYLMGADRVLSFDYDQDSVATTEQVRQHAGNPDNWQAAQGSVLDRALVENLPKFDIVYAWGVLHHTGDMWNAIRNAATAMKPDGLYYIALYSSDIYVNPPPEYWLKVKRRYNRSTARGKRIMEWWYVFRFHALPALKTGQNLLEVIRKYGSTRRGMTFWTDVKDWLGGYPMDFASLRQTRSFCKEQLGLDLVNVKAGEGCTEYLFCRTSHNELWRAICEQRALVPLRGPFERRGGAGYVSHLLPLESQADHEGAPRRSELMLYEDGQMLGLAHSRHDHIMKYGRGRFSHWGKELIFSTSDNTDPNVNGRAYSYCEKF